MWTTSYSSLASDLVQHRYYQKRDFGATANPSAPPTELWGKMRLTPYGGQGKNAANTDWHYYKYWGEQKFLERDHLSPEENTSPVWPGMNTDRLPHSYLHIPECLCSMTEGIIIKAEISASLPEFITSDYIKTVGKILSKWLQPIWPLNLYKKFWKKYINIIYI